MRALVLLCFLLLPVLVHADEQTMSKAVRSTHMRPAENRSAKQPRGIAGAASMGSFGDRSR